MQTAKKSRIDQLILTWLGVFSTLGVLQPLTVVEALASPRSTAIIKKKSQRDPAQAETERQAKELLGKHYKKVAKSVSRPDAVTKYIRETTQKSLSKKWRKQSAKISRTIIAEAHRYGFDPVFLVSVIQTESAFNPLAVGTSGEIGLMQLMPDTGKWVAGEFDIRWQGKKTLRDPVKNIQLGAAYLSLLREKFGSDSRLYIPAYNMGPNAVKRSVSEEVIPVIYARRVMQKYLQNYDRIRQKRSSAEVLTSSTAAKKASHPQAVVRASEQPHSSDDNT